MAAEGSESVMMTLPSPDSPRLKSMSSIIGTSRAGVAGVIVGVTPCDTIDDGPPPMVTNNDCP